MGDVVQATSSSDGITWAKPTTITGVANEFFTAPAVGPQGQFYLAYTDFGTTGQSTILFTTSLDNGVTYSTPTVAATSTINTFLPSRYTIPPQNSRGISPNPGLAVEQSGTNAGRIYMVYCSTPTKQHNNTDIELIGSDNGGSTWTALGTSPVKVNDDHTGKSQFFPAMAIDQTNGTVNIAWYDARNSTTDKQVDIYFADFSSAGKRNGHNVKVTTAMSDETNNSTNNANQYGDYISIAATGGLAYPAWCDHRNGLLNGEEIYVDPPPPGQQTDGAETQLTDGALASALVGSALTPAVATQSGAISAAPVTTAYGAGLATPRAAHQVLTPNHRAAGGLGSSNGEMAIRENQQGIPGNRLMPLPALSDSPVTAIAALSLENGDPAALPDWSVATDSYFVGDNWESASMEHEVQPVAVMDHADTAVELAAAAVGFAFAFNGLGGRRREEAEMRIPRRLPS
jgi:hypothetical protein